MSNILLATEPRRDRDNVVCTKEVHKNQLPLQLGKKSKLEVLLLRVIAKRSSVSFFWHETITAKIRNV